MFVLCESMKWAHLPVAGGLYDQHPDLLDAFKVLFGIRARIQEEEHKKEEAERNRMMGKSGRKPRPRTSSRAPRR